MYTQALNTSEAEDRDRRGRRPRRAIPGAHRCRRSHRAERLDARGLPQDADAADFPARAFRNRRHAARRQLDHPRAVAAPQGRAARQGAGRMRPRALPLCRRRNTRQLARGTGRPDAGRKGKVFLDLQLSDADLGGYRRDRLAGRWRRDHEPDPAVPLFLRSLCARDDPRLQGGILSPAPGLRDHADAVARQRRTEGDGAGRARSLVVAGADDVRSARQSEPAQRHLDPMEDQALLQ